MKSVLKRLFGFRSGKPWKMILAGLYYLCGFVVLFFGLSTPMAIQAGPYDQTIYGCSILILFLWIMSPAIFLSDTPLRDYLPLFKKRIRTESIVGMMIVFLFFAYLFGSVESLHTPQYQAEFEAYTYSTYQGFVEAGSR